ncbi:uncharacterized protein LOC129595485 [Paramacrobiotus metropolitanus]|uniref:uncharacterized protein LOC129595485 n=1 Tax=Paramacrobiotus metropolitanus TaxID=2943436 RepID=UPI0024460433|nr:uncharacterized protein LOC129595485 [Paramacrobiotus metropolitanus]
MDRLLVTAAIVCVLAYSLPVYRACGTRPKFTIEKINQILDEAKQCSHNGTLHLNGYGSPANPDEYPSAEFPPSTKIFRAPEGGTVVIPCDNRVNQNNSQVSHVKIPPAFTKNGYHIPIPTVDKIAGPDVPRAPMYICNCGKKYDPLDLVGWENKTVREYDLATGAFSIHLPAFSHAYTGLYECLHSDGQQLVVTQRYWVTPQLSRNEVFTPPMNNVSVRLGDPAEMACVVRFHALPGLLGDRFLWRKGHDLLYARSVKDFASRVTHFSGIFQFGLHDHCSCNSTMKIVRVGREHAGRYDCWFRTDDRLDEWIVQEAYLHLV